MLSHAAEGPQNKVLAELRAQLQEQKAKRRQAQTRLQKAASDASDGCSKRFGVKAINGHGKPETTEAQSSAQEEAKRARANRKSCVARLKMTSFGILTTRATKRLEKKRISDQE